MEESNEVKIIGMLGEMNNKISEINLNIKDIKEKMNRNFAALADSQVTTAGKIEEIGNVLTDIRFRVSVAEAGVGLNANRIKELDRVR